MDRWKLLVVAAAVSGLAAGCSSGTEAGQIAAVRDVISSVVDNADDIVLEIIPSSGSGKDCYEIVAEGGDLVLRGSSPVALCYAFDRYLRYGCGAMVTWSGEHVDIPGSWPEYKESAESPYDLRYFLNVCTFGYTAPYWDWERWSEEIDWMALHGVNMPLASVASEAIAMRVWKKFGLTDEEIGSFFTGPAYLPWHRMGNINGFDGPLTADWHKDQIALQHRILDKMRALGMQPVAPAFAGFVPPAFMEKYPDAHVRQLEWLVKRDRNRPCVILWSVFNEEPMQGTENGYEMVRRMRDVVEQLDTTRPVTAAMNGGLFEPYNVSQAVEIVGFNYQHYAYDEFHQKNPTLKLTSSEDCSAFQVRGEYQTDMKHNIIDSYDTRAADWGQTHRDNWKAINERPFLAGSFVWTGFDYRGEPTPFRWPSASSFFGIMDLCGFPKMAYYLRQAQWIEERPVMHLVPHWNWPTDSIGKPIKVMTLTNADSVRVLLNGKQVGAEKVDKYEMNTFYIPYKPGKLEAIGYKGEKECVRYQVETTGEAKRVHLIPYRESLVGDGRDAMPITVEVVDKKGRHIPTANLPMEFSISGPGRIVGVGNGNPNSHEPDKAMKRNLFNGYAQVIVQTNKGATEPILLTASTPGLESATIQIHTITSEGGPAVEVVNPSIVLDRWMLSPFSAERLDPTIELVENDMNSWQQINAGTLSDMPGDGYYLCRTSFAPFAIHKQKGGVLRLREVYGEAEVWVNGKQLATKQEAACADLEVPFPPTSEEINVRILFKGSPSSPIGLGKAALIER